MFLLYSIFLGNKRRFLKKKLQKNPVLDIMLEDKIVLIMCGNIQKEFKHFLPKMKCIKDCE